MCFLTRFNGEILRRLIDEAGLTRPEVAAATLLSASTIDACIDGRMGNPSMKTLLALADFFAVPLDFLVGRCDKEQAEKILKNYGECFMELRRAPFEAYLHGRKGTIGKNLVGEAPWPYNLLNAVFPNLKIDDTVSKEHEEEIIEAMQSVLSPKQLKFILAYYRDGKTLSKIGKSAGLSGERVRQIITKAQSTLTYPPQSSILLYGKDISNKNSEIKIMEIRVLEKRQELARIQEELDEKYKKILEAQTYLYEYGIEAMKMVEAISDAVAVLPPVPEKKIVNTANIRLDDAFLKNQISQRAYNALMRFGCKTLADVVDIAKAGELIKIRNLGRVSTRELLAKIEELTGKDYFGVGNNPTR